MSQSSSGVYTSSDSFPKSFSSGYSELSSTSISLPFATRHRVLDEQTCDSGLCSPLPSDRFKYITWHQLEGHDIHGTQIHCPRVRKAPSDEQLFLRGEECGHLMRKRKTEKEDVKNRLQENWENSLEVNLSYQDLGDSYQQENFYRILRRLIRVEKLQLIDNSLMDLSSFRLPRVFSSLPNLKVLDGIPKMPTDCALAEQSLISKMCLIL
ncbi:uncharacterized protein LOC122800750 isoform X2 [Protopterus annectens]|uniref:uncharacterized protein LOC122800750 isoform X2 n=1 Tax=Protopterus annectens TaxID=7888 RepID=UPI001CFBFE4B|nr:uncharacterized protein LOC122800750 isoform X2 [Protopterus annectens]